jgi:hypothetical protein
MYFLCIDRKIQEFVLEGKRKKGDTIVYHNCRLFRFSWCYSSDHLILKRWLCRSRQVGPSCRLQLCTTDDDSSSASPSPCRHVEGFDLISEEDGPKDCLTIFIRLNRLLYVLTIRII